MVPQMTDLTGFNHSAPIINTLEQRLNEKGIIVLNRETDTEGTTVYAMGMGNKFKANVFVPKMTEAPDDNTSQALIQEYIEDVEAGLRRGISE